MIVLAKSDWWQDLSPRGKSRVNIATTVPREPDAMELNKIGDYLFTEGKIDKNNPYNVSQFALTALRDAFKKVGLL